MPRMLNTAKGSYMKSYKPVRLLKRGANGASLFWEIEVVPGPGEAATIITRHGHIDGEVIETKEVIKEGKNAGKKNATTPGQQAVLEATAKHTAQLERKGYGLSLDASAAVRSTMPMLAQSYDKVKDLKWAKARAQPKLDGCLSEAYIIEFSDGRKLTIAEVVAGQVAGDVKSFNTDTREIEWQPIEAWMQDRDGDVGDWYEIELADGRTLPPLTGDHLMYLPKLECWRRVDQLKAADLLLTD